MKKYTIEQTKKITDLLQEDIQLSDQLNKINARAKLASELPAASMLHLCAPERDKPKKVFKPGAPFGRPEGLPRFIADIVGEDEQDEVCLKLTISDMEAIKILTVLISSKESRRKEIHSELEKLGILINQQL